MRTQGRVASSLSVRPTEGLVDEVPEIVVTGVAPGAEVRIDVSEVDANQERWSSWAIFKADASGVATTGHVAIAGTYVGSDEAGVFWSMQPSVAGAMYRAGADRITSLIEASVDGGPIGAVEAHRLIGSAAVRRIDVDSDGVRGVLFEPTEPRGLGVIAVQGSGGGVNESESALLASHGFTALALSYFNFPGQPSTLADIPLEYFENAGRWLLARPTVRTQRCALIGQSRGGELVLLLAATFPNVFGPVVSTSPSSQVWGGMGSATAAWTFEGRPLAYMDATEPATPLKDVPPPIPLTPLFEGAMHNDEHVASTAIPIERADCSILLLSGADDAMWPSADFAKRVMARLARYGYSRSYRHQSFPRAGHTISGIPNIPVVTHALHPVAHLDFAYGGTAEGTARARREAWRLRLEFLGEAATR